MLLIQMTGLSGAGKSTIAKKVAKQLIESGYKVELIDGDEYRKHLCSDLGFKKTDRIENIRRLGFVALTLAKHGVISILAAINPYQEAREALKNNGSHVKTVFIDCPIDVTSSRDTKGLYHKAKLPPDHPEHVQHFTGISDPYETPVDADLVIHTDIETVDESSNRLLNFILQNIP